MRNPLRRVTVTAVLVLMACNRAVLTSGLSAPDPSDLIGHSKFNWTADSAGRIRVYSEAGAGSAISPARIQSAVAYVDSVLELMPDSRLVSIFVVASPDRMNTLLGHRVEGRSFYQTGVVAIVPTSSWEATTRHELTHVQAGRHWGRASSQWISEGTATWVGNPFFGRDIRVLARDRLLRTGRLIPLATLDDSFGRAPDEVTYLQSAAVAQFLATRFGIGALRAVWQDGITAIPRATRLTVEEFEREWRKYLSA